MSLPVFSSLVTLDTSAQALPFCEGPTASAINLMTMDVSFMAQPFVRNLAAAGGFVYNNLPLLVLI